MSVPIYDPVTKAVAFMAAILVATLAYFGYNYAEAERAQSEECFVNGIVRALTFFGGVVATLLPDNLKAGVITHTQTTIRLSRAIMEVASYYQLFVDPTRVRRPLDKAKVDSRRWECEQLVDSDLAEVAGCRKIQ